MNKRSGIFGAMSLLAAIFAAPVHAQEFGLDKRIYIAPGFAYTLADTDRLTDDGIGGSIAIGRRFTEGMLLEFTGFYSQYDANTGDNTLEFKGAGLAALISPFREWKNLYLVLALHEGSTSDAPGPRANYRSTVFDTGIGYNFSLGDWLNGASVRADARYRMDSHESRNVGGSGDTEHYDGVFGFALQIPIGSYGYEEEEEGDDSVQIVSSSSADSDNDGVGDAADRCPGTAPGAIVDRNGCELDTDVDGVVDRLDQCPGTPAGTQVDNVGCPAAPENCRPPFPGEAVDENGCASGDTVVLRGVTFEFDEARLTANAQVILNGVADTLLGAQDIKVEIGGHTDSLGSESYNQQLSERRAKSVLDYLARRGVDAGRMSSRGYGESDPIESNESASGRELNRRVELKIID